MRLLYSGVWEEDKSLNLSGCTWWELFGIFEKKQSMVWKTSLTVLFMIPQKGLNRFTLYILLQFVFNILYKIGLYFLIYGWLSCPLNTIQMLCMSNIFSNYNIFIV